MKSSSSNNNNSKPKRNFFIRGIRSLIDFITMFEGLSLIAFITLILMVVHTAHVYLHFEPDPSRWTIYRAYVFGFVMDVAVLVFVVRGQINTAYFFSFIQVCINLLYYYYNGYLTGVNIIGASFLSIILPYVIAKYSHLIRDTVVREQQAKRRAIKEQRERGMEENARKPSDENLFDKEIRAIKEKMSQVEELTKRDIEDLKNQIGDISINYSGDNENMVTEIDGLKTSIDSLSKAAKRAEEKAAKANKILYSLEQVAKDKNKKHFEGITKEDTIVGDND